MTRLAAALITCLFFSLISSSASARRMNPAIVSAQGAGDDRSCFAVSVPANGGDIDGHTTVYSVDSGGNHVLYELDGYAPNLRVKCGNKLQKLEQNFLIRSRNSFRFSQSGADTTALEIFRAGKLVKSYSFKQLKRTEKSYWADTGLGVGDFEGRPDSVNAQTSISFNASNLDTEYVLDANTGEILKTSEKINPLLQRLNDFDKKAMEEKSSH